MYSGKGSPVLTSWVRRRNGTQKSDGSLNTPYVYGTLANSGEGNPYVRESRARMERWATYEGQGCIQAVGEIVVSPARIG